MIKYHEFFLNYIKENKKTNLKIIMSLFVILLVFIPVIDVQSNISATKSDPIDPKNIYASSLTNITLPEPDFIYNNDTNYLEIPEFDVTFTNDTGTYVLNNTNTEIAKFYLVYRLIHNDVEQDPVVSSYGNNLSYSNGKWLFPSTFITGLAANTNHSIIYLFKMSDSENTWSNISSDRFYINLFPVEITGFNIDYDWDTRILVINDILVTCPTYSDIGIVNDSNTNLANWYLYARAVGREVMVAAYDTQGTKIEGELDYNNVTNTWSSLDNDIGWVFTPSSVEYVIVIRFNLTDLPSGFYKIPYGFIPYIQAVSNPFVTRPHVITVSKPTLVFNEATMTVNVYNITAYTDYHNIILDYYQMIEKDIFGEDLRFSCCYLCPPHSYEDPWAVGGITYGIEYADRLLWNETMQWWYLNDISVSHLTGGEYWICARFVNEVMNSTHWVLGPASNTFIIEQTGLNSTTFVFAFTTILILTITKITLKDKKKKKHIH